MTRALALALAFLGLAALGARADDAPPPRNVILFIGDGMGPTHVTLGRLVADRPLALDSVKTIGLVRTTSLTGPVTDSSAAITAIASGVKTRNKMLGVDGEGRPVRSIADDLEDAGYRVGLVTTTRVTHATPAGFYAHVAERDDEAKIRAQLAASRVSVCLGGGLRVFGGAGAAGRAVREAGFQLVRDRAGLALARSFADGERVLGLFAESHLAFEIDRAGTDAKAFGIADQPSLREMTAAALELLAPAREPPAPPFFLMVEGGRIDHACHGHDAVAAAREVIAFDDAVAAGLAFAQRRGDTLVLVTADHTTGGLAISEHADVAAIRRVKGSAMAMLAAAVKVAPDDRERALRGLVREKAGVELTEAEAAEALADRWKYAKAGFLARTISQRLGLHFAFTLEEQDKMDSAEGHDGTTVPVYAAGPGEERFRGTIENTDIARTLRDLLGVGGAAAKIPGKAPDRRERQLF